MLPGLCYSFFVPDIVQSIFSICQIVNSLKKKFQIYFSLRLQSLLYCVAVSIFSKYLRITMHQSFSGPWGYEGCQDSPMILMFSQLRADNEIQYLKHGGSCDAQFLGQVGPGQKSLWRRSHLGRHLRNVCGTQVKSGQSLSARRRETAGREGWKFRASERS